MKIVHICLGFPIEFPGGITNYVASLSRAQGKENEVIVYSGENTRNFSKVDEEIFSNKRYNSKNRNFSLNFLSEDSSVNNLFENLKSEMADIYHFHSVLSIDLRLMKLFSVSELKYVVSFHDYNMVCPRVYMVDKWDNICHEVSIEKCRKCVGFLDQIDFVKRISDKLNFSLPVIRSNNIEKRENIFRKFLQNSSANLAVSKRVKKIYEVFKDVKIETISIGNESAKYFSPRTYNDIDELTIAFLGSFDIKKGAKIFIDICKNSQSNTKFVVYGRGDKNLIDEFEQVGGEYKGTYTPEQLRSILNRVHIGCVLSIWEDNGPQVTMELINNCIPTIGTNRGGIPDFIFPGTGLVIEPEDISTAVDWVDSLTLDKLNELCRNIKPLKTPEFHARELIYKYEEILK